MDGVTPGDMYHRTYERWDYAPAQGTGIGGAIYVVLGVFVALAYNYFEHLTTFVRLLEAMLAVMLWPLLLFGIHINLN